MENVLLVQVSDIHVKDEKSIGLSRLAELAPAVGSLRDECPHVIFLLTGDIAFSGKGVQYGLIRSSLEQVASRLRSEWRFQTVDFVTCPGNHDCDFELQKAVVREALLSSISGEGDDQIDLVHELSEVQSSYYDFADAIEGGQLARHTVVRKMEKDVGGRKLNFLSLNTAWSSRIQEQPGSLRMPTSVLVDPGASSELTIALLHHPLNWYDPQDGKSLSDWLDTNADIALWGHEHREDSFRVVRRRYGSSVQHFLARPIDDKDVECGFRALELRSDGTFVEASFRWRGGRFEVERKDQSSIKKNPARQLGRVRFSTDFRAFLSDPGISFKHPRLERPLMLQDIFIEPSFRAYSSNPVELEKTDSSLTLSAMMEALSGHPSSVVSGPEHSGKTTFAKYLVEDARHHGITPLYFDGARLRSSNRGEVTTWIRASIDQQYAADCVQLVEQVPPASRMVIVDNVHELRGNAATVREILERVATLGARVIYLSAQNPAVTILAASHSSGEEIKLWSDAKWFELLPLGNRARGDLIRRWVATGRDETADSQEIESEVRRVKALLDGALGRSLSIKLPFFLLAMLQQIDAGKAAKTVVRNGSHGHIFEAMLSTSIEGSVRSHDVGTTHDFLAAFAFVTWTSEGASISDSGFEELISQFRRDKLMQLSHPGLKEELTASKVLGETAAGVGFRYPHFYYYGSSGTRVGESGAKILR